MPLHAGMGQVALWVVMVAFRNEMAAAVVTRFVDSVSIVVL